MKKLNSYFWLSLISALLTIIMFGSSVAMSFPKSTISENGDITINVCGLFIHHLEVQQFETNLETLETELVYVYQPVDLTDSQITISNEFATELNSFVFYDGVDCKITFGEVKAYFRPFSFILSWLLYVAIVIYLIPYLFNKKFT